MKEENKEPVATLFTSAVAQTMSYDITIDNRIFEPQDDIILRYDELEQHYLEKDFTDIIIYDLIGYWTTSSFDDLMSNDFKTVFEVEL